MDNKRLLPFQGGRNFRDLGGYAAADGRSVKWGHLYRSGTLHRLTAADHARLADLDIQLICDLRTRPERVSEPTNWPDEQADLLSFDYDLPGRMDHLRQLASGKDWKAEDTAAMMVSMYATIAYDHLPQYRALFERLVDGQAPLIVHCTAGKDRAGTAAALILTALGVSRDDVIEDYSLSEKYVDFAQEFTAAGSDAKDTPYAFLADMPLEVIAPMMSSDRAYIEALLSQLEKDHGSALGFIQKELGLSDENLASIRNRFLQ